MTEKTTAELLKLPVAAHEERLALCVTLRVLRGIPEALAGMASSGEFDARRLAQLEGRVNA